MLRILFLGTGSANKHAIELVKELKDPRYKLVISHEAGDEGFEYYEWLKEYACEHGVELFLINTAVADPWACDAARQNRYTLWDIKSPR